MPLCQLAEESPDIGPQPFSRSPIFVLDHITEDKAKKKQGITIKTVGMTEDYGKKARNYNQDCRYGRPP